MWMGEYWQQSVNPLMKIEKFGPYKGLEAIDLLFLEN